MVVAPNTATASEALPTGVAQPDPATAAGVCTVTQVEEVKMVLKLLPIWSTCILFWTVYSQMTTFSVEQATFMDRRIGPSFVFPAGSLSFFLFITILLFTSLNERLLVPLARRLTRHPQGVTSLQRVGVGLVLSAISMATAALVEVKRRDAALDPTNPRLISIFWLSFQFGIFGIADMFTLVGLMEFFYSEAPAGMRSLSTSFAFLSLSFGYFLSTIFVDIINAITSRTSANRQGWLLGLDLNHSRLDYFYWFLAVLSCINFLNYLFWANWYKYKDATTNTTTTTTKRGQGKGRQDCDIDLGEDIHVLQGAVGQPAQRDQGGDFEAGAEPGGSALQATGWGRARWHKHHNTGRGEPGGVHVRRPRRNHEHQGRQGGPCPQRARRRRGRWAEEGNRGQIQQQRQQHEREQQRADHQQLHPARELLQRRQPGSPRGDVDQVAGGVGGSSSGVDAEVEVQGGSASEEARHGAHREAALPPGTVPGIQRRRRPETPAPRLPFRLRRRSQEEESHQRR
uniref:Nitrate transporter 1.3 n=2 Tax=Anthurium amnicola TaxID=1678845 RepID=A0A1D1ZF76_9ARAE